MNFCPVSPGHMFCITLGMFSIPHQFEQIQGDKLDAHLFVLNAIVSLIFFLNIFLRNRIGRICYGWVLQAPEAARN